MSSWIGGFVATGRSRAVRSPEYQQALQGIEQCRRGDWNEGIGHLAKAAASAERGSLPGLVFSFLGYGLALKEGRVDDGLALCRHALRVQLFEPENHLNLARTQLLADDRSAAYRTVREGLRVDRNDKELQAMRRQLGVRRPPVFSFLARHHPLNRAFGRLRHAVMSVFNAELEAPKPRARPASNVARAASEAAPSPASPTATSASSPTRPAPPGPKSLVASRGRAS